MARYWSDTDGWIEAEVLWDGVGPTPAELRSRDGFRQRESPLFKMGVADKADGSLPTAREMRGKTNGELYLHLPNSRPLRSKDHQTVEPLTKAWQARCACGRVRSKNNRRCAVCRNANRKLQKPYPRKERAA